MNTTEFDCVELNESELQDVNGGFIPALIIAIGAVASLCAVADYAGHELGRRMN